MGRWLHLWSALPDSVRSGQPAEDPWLHLGKDPAYTREFALAMEDYARLRGSEIVKHLDLSGAQRLLDLGGGPGAYAVLFASRWPDLRITVFDLPEIAQIAAERIAAAGLAGRIAIRGGNYEVDDIGSGYDVVFLSDTLHQETPEGAERLLQRAAAALRPGGKLVVQGMFLNDDQVSPRWPVVLSLILLLFQGGGRTYTVAETIRQIERAGFQNCEHRQMSLLNVNSLVMADRP
jgi:cyclopropane fatty-acyl-phospholipid synthase-like methyltransferase